MKVVLVMWRDGKRRDFPLTAEKTILGRRQECELRIPTKDVSRQHCALLVEDNALTVKDLGSANGTYVNDKRIAETDLKAGDRLRVGPVTFVVQINGKPGTIKPEDAMPAAAAGAAVAAGRDDEETFDLSNADLELSDGDFDLDDVMEEIGDEDDDDMP